jgi:hypothetical protein
VLLPGVEPGAPEALWNGMLVIPSLGTVLAEAVGAALLVWGAVERLKRT